MNEIKNSPETGRFYDTKHLNFNAFQRVLQTFNTYSLGDKYYPEKGRHESLKIIVFRTWVDEENKPVEPKLPSYKGVLKEYRI